MKNCQFIYTVKVRILDIFSLLFIYESIDWRQYITLCWRMCFKTSSLTLCSNWRYAEGEEEKNAEVSLTSNRSWPTILPAPEEKKRKGSGCEQTMCEWEIRLASCYFLTKTFTLKSWYNITVQRGAFTPVSSLFFLWMRFHPMFVEDSLKKKEGKWGEHDWRLWLRLIICSKVTNPRKKWTERKKKKWTPCRNDNANNLEHESQYILEQGRIQDFRQGRALIGFK